MIFCQSWVYIKIINDVIMKQIDVINSFFKFTGERGYDRKERSNLISPYFNNEFNLSAGHQYVIPILRSTDKKSPVKIAINEICIRRVDLEKLGESNYHLLMFEMGVMGVFGYMDNINTTLFTVLHDVIDFIKLLGFNMDEIYFSVSEGAIILHKRYPADEMSFHALRAQGIKETNIIKTKGRQNFILSNGVDRPAGNSIEIFTKRNGSFVEIASINVYKYLFRDGKLNPMLNHAIGGGFGFDRITYLLNDCNSIFEIPPFSMFADRIKTYFRNENEFQLNRTRIYRIIELIKTLVFIEKDGQLPDETPHGKIMKSFIKKLKSEITYLELNEKEVINLGRNVIKNHYINYEW